MKENGTIEKSRLYPSPNPHVRLTEITYWSNGLRVKGLLAEPIKEGTYAGMIYLRGGIQHVGMVRPARMAQLASEGLIVFAPYYRGNRGGEGRDEFAGADRLDAVYAVDVLQQHPRVQEGGVHVFAFSRGGIMALWLAILRDDIRSVVTWAGVSDLVFTYKERRDLRRMMKRVIGGTPNNAVEAYRERHVLDQVDQIEAPVLIIHGMLDQHVSFEQAKLLENALTSQKKHVETWYFPQFHHHIPPASNREIVRNLSRWSKAQRPPLL